MKIYKPARRPFLSEKGFTLIELLVVVAIIGILVAIAIPQFSAYKQQANDGSAKSDLRNIALSIESYYATNSQYPTGNTAAVLASLTAIGFVASGGVTVNTILQTDGATDLVASSTEFSATAYHGNGTKTFTWRSDLGGLQ